MEKVPYYKEVGFAPASLGGLAIELVTEQGYFYVFGITREMDELEYYYSPDGKMVYDEINYTKNYEIDIDFEEGTYERLLPHVKETVSTLGLDEKAGEMYDEWRKEVDAPKMPVEREKRIPRELSPETKKYLAELFNLDDV